MHGGLVLCSVIIFYIKQKKVFFSTFYNMQILITKCLTFHYINLHNFPPESTTKTNHQNQSCALKLEYWSPDVLFQKANGHPWVHSIPAKTSISKDHPAYF